MPSGRRYLLDLSPEQEERCEEFGSVCRSAWNTALDQRWEYWRRGACMNYVPQAAELADAKASQGSAFLVLQQTLREWTGYAGSMTPSTTGRISPQAKQTGTGRLSRALPGRSAAARTGVRPSQARGGS
ncbi:helix-turn-helix domain-containing protein (plasmid) [Streptomyces sp. HUAS TT11]|uniref:helix-turn-helix domain-containing protein n=1 Tax=Streptomyces sp. HUAS TT11 TaxID=3447508 RepID=UPI003F65AA56